MPQPRARIALIYPPSRTQRHFSCPMGLLMLASVLEREGYEVHLLDANAARRRLSADDVVAKVRELRPDVVGMTLVTPLVKGAYRLAAALRDSGAKLLAGGSHATLLPDEPVEHGFDATVVGEGEPTIVEAIEALLGRMPMDAVKGLVYRGQDGAIQRNAPRPVVPDLDTLPLPARHLVNPAEFGTPIEAIHMNLFTSRGCPARCAYCAGGLFGKRFRFRSAKSVVDEMMLVHREYGARHFHFVDDAMTMDRERARQVCEQLIAAGRPFTWTMMTRIDAVDEEMLALASRAGCVGIDFGIESGHRETLRRVHKPHTAEMVRRIIPLTHRYGMRPQVFFILGFPWEDVEAIDVTLQLMADIAEYVEFHPAVASVLIPFPGTEIYDRYHKEHGFDSWWLSDDRTYDAADISTHPFYQAVFYRIGAVLDADFFHYPAHVKNKIHEVFRFMWASNLRRRGRLTRQAVLFALDISKTLHTVSPRLEHAVFVGPMKAWETVKRLRERAS